MNDIPKPSRSVMLPRFGGSEVLEITTGDAPDFGKDQILVHVAAASLNAVDWKVRKGAFPFLSANDLPVPLGCDLAGTVKAVGGEAGGRFQEGARVFAAQAGIAGSQSDYVAVDVAALAIAPKSVDVVHAAALPLAGLTAWQGLFDHGGLQKGQRVLIHGGAGGVGHLAVQFAKAAGAGVIATCSGDDLDFVRGLGADTAIDYKLERFEDVAKDVDLVLDLVGGETQDRSWSTLRRGGILVCTVGPSDTDKAEAVGARAARPFLAQPNGTQLSIIAKMIDSGSVKVTVAETYPIEQIAKAHDRLEQGHVRGKIVLTLT